MLGEPAWYWILFAVAVVALVAAPVCAWLEDRQERTDRDLLDKIDRERLS